MKQKKEYNVNDVIILDDNREYIVIKKIDEHYLLLSSEQPLKILVVILKDNIFKLVLDKSKIIEILTMQ